MLSFLESNAATRGVVGLRFVGASPRVALDREDLLPGEVNYLSGSDPAGWRTHVPSSAQVVYRELWPGVDMGCGTTQEASNTSSASGRAHGSRTFSLRTTERIVSAGSGLVCSTFLGGFDIDDALAIAVDRSGNAFVGGETGSSNFPTTAVWNGDPLIFWAAFVTKFAVGSPLPPSPPSTPPPPPPRGTLPAPTLVSPGNDARFSPGTSITFDWTDVAGAASYTIQMDNSQTFAAPFTVDQTMDASQLTTSALPVTRMWWRARANSSIGAAGLVVGQTRRDQELRPSPA